MKLQCYADRNRDVDMSVGKWHELCGVVTAAQTKMAAAGSFMEPELLSYDEKLLLQFRNDPDFSDFSRYFDAILLNKPHTLSPNEEKIMAHFGGISLGEYETYSTFSSTDMKFPEIEIDGEKMERTSRPTLNIAKAMTARRERKFLTPSGRHTTATKTR